MYTLYNKNVKLLTGDENYFYWRICSKVKSHTFIHYTMHFRPHTKSNTRNAYRYLSKVYDINPERSL